MKKTAFTSYLTQIATIVFILLLFTQCKNDAQFKKDISTVVATVFFFVFMLIGGIPSVVLSAVSINSKSASIKIVAIVFISIFAICCLFSVPLYAEFWREGAKEWIGFLSLLQFGSLVLSIILLVVGYNKRSALAQVETPQKVPVQVVQEDDDIDYMDEILND